MNRNELKTLTRLAVTALIFLCLLLGIDYAAGRSVDYYMKKKQLDTFSGLEYAKYVKADVLIFGASQAEVGYNSELISERTGLRAVNLATSSSNSIYSYILLKNYLSTIKPKAVVYDVSTYDVHDIEHSVNVAKNLGYLYKKDKDIDAVLSSIIPNANLTLFFNLYRYHLLVPDILRNRSVKKAHDHYRPYEPDNAEILNALIDRNLKEIGKDWPKTETKSASCDTSSVSYKCLYKLIALCRDNDIQLILVYSPSYHGEANEYNLFPMPVCLEKTKSDEKMSFLNISVKDYPFFSNKHIYHDFAHLNRIGSDSLSAIISEEIVKRVKLDKIVKD